MLLRQVKRVQIQQIFSHEDAVRVIHRRQAGEKSRQIQYFVVGEAQHRVQKRLEKILQPKLKN